MKCGEEEGGKWERGGEMGMGHKEERVKNAVWLRHVERWGECGKNVVDGALCTISRVCR